MDASVPPSAWGGKRITLHGNPQAGVLDLEVIAERGDGYTRYISVWQPTPEECEEIVLHHGRVVIQQTVYDGAGFNPIGAAIEGIVPA